MISGCHACGAFYEDETQLTYCPHEDFAVRKLVTRAVLADPDLMQLIEEGDWDSIRGMFGAKLRETPTEFVP